MIHIVNHRLYCTCIVSPVFEATVSTLFDAKSHVSMTGRIDKLPH